MIVVKDIARGCRIVTAEGDACANFQGGEHDRGRDAFAAGLITGLLQGLALHETGWPMSRERPP